MYSIIGVMSETSGTGKDQLTKTTIYDKTFNVRVLLLD